MRFPRRRFQGLFLSSFLVFLATTAPPADAAPSGPQRRRPPLVSLGEVVEREVRDSLRVVGTVAPYRASVVGSEIEGLVRRLPLKEGDAVVAGKTVIAALQRSDLEIELRMLRAELEKVQQDHLRLKRGSRKEEIEGLRAKLREREAILRRYELELKRTEDLYKGQVIDRSTYDRAVADYQSNKNQVIEVQNLLRLAEIGPREEEIAKAKAEVDRVRAQVDGVRDALSKAVIRSPLTGFLTEKWVEVGQWVQKGGRVAEVIELQRVLVRVPIAERQIEHVRVGDTARVAIDALGGRSFVGKVRNIIPKADLKSRTFPVDVELANTPAYEIKAGMFARVSMHYGPAARAVLVPKDAILLRAQGASVFVFQEGKVREVNFAPGRSVDSFVEVPAGSLKAGMKVVVKGNENLRAGMPVRVRGAGPPQGGGGGQRRPSAGGGGGKRPQG